MKRPLGALACAILIAACGGEPSVASKSAAAYEKAPPAPTAADHAAMGHASSATDAHAAHAAPMSETHARHGASRGVADHSGHAAASAGGPSHAQHSPTAPADHSHDPTQQPAARAADPHAGHGPAAARPISAAPPDLQRVEPAATLRPDPFDAPAAASVAEAGRGAGNATGEADVYACPVHSEVTSAMPGLCPKCGMTLVKREKK